MIGEKYLRFTQWLQNCGEERIQLTFDDLNRIIPIPDAAYKYRSYWANPKNPQSFQASWINAGYHVSMVSFEHHMVTFEKIAVTEPKAMTSISQNDTTAFLIQKGHQCLNAMRNTPNHRYLSWEHCHQVFSNAKGHSLSDFEIDYLSLHLAWYLASWGMLRNSFLMQFDYQIHVPVIELLMKPEWDDIWDLTAEHMSQEAYAKKVQQLYMQISEVYKRTTGNIPTDTLVTKILLGTVGCSPAYDQYFKFAVSTTKKASRTFGYKSIVQLGNEYLAHYNEYEALRKLCSQGISYPAAKVLDMCFFEYGLQNQKGEDIV